MSDITRVDVKITGTVDPPSKGAFAEASKTFSDFFRGVGQGWKEGAEQLKAQQNAADTFSKKISGRDKTDVVGAFNLATTAAEAFGLGLKRALPILTVVEMGREAVLQSMNLEESRNRILSTHKMSRAELAEQHEDWKKWAPLISKPILELDGDMFKLLATNDKLKVHFELLQKLGKATSMNWDNVLRMANVQMANGVSPQDLPRFLNVTAEAYRGINDEGAKASIEVSQNLEKNGIKGAQVQEQLNAVLGGLIEVSAEGTKTTELLTKFMDKMEQGGGGGLRMAESYEQLKAHKKSYVQFLDDLVRLNHPDDPDFDNKMRNDPGTKQLIVLLVAARHKIQENLDAADKDFTKSEIFEDSSAAALQRFTDALKELFALIGDKLPVVQVLESVTAGLKQDIIDFKAMMKLYEDTEKKAGDPDLFFGRKPPKTLETVPYAPRAPGGNLPSDADVDSLLRGEPLSPMGESLMGSWPASKMNPASPGDVPPMRKGGHGPGMAQVGEAGGEVIVGPEGVRRSINQATIVNLDDDESVVPTGASTGLPQRHQPGFNTMTDRFGPSPGGWYYTNATTYGGHPGDAARGIPYVKDPDDTFGSNQAEVKEQYQGISLPGKPFGGTENRGPELNKLYQVQLPDGSFTVQRVTDTGPGHSGHGGTDMSVGALARERLRHKTFDGPIRYKALSGSDKLPTNMSVGRNLVTAGGFLDTSSGEGALHKNAPDYDIPNRWMPPPEQQAWRPMRGETVKRKVELVPPERHEIERAARSTTSRARNIGRREEQSAHAGRIGHM